METTLYAVIFLDGRIFRVNCRGKNQKKRFRLVTDRLKDEIKDIMEIINGIHTVSEFEKY